MNLDADFQILSLPSYFGFSTKDYQYWHQLLDKRTIVFNTEIDEDVIESVYLPMKDFEEDESQRPVKLILNSPGGSVTDGFFLADYISQYKKPLHIYVTGYAASMAAILLAAGGKNENVTRFCYPSSYALIHDGYIALQASESKTAADIMDFNRKVDDNIRDFIIKNTNITPEMYDAQARKQWFIFPDEMKELGLIDKIVGRDA